MALAKFINDDLFEMALERIQGDTGNISAAALYAGAKVIADEMRKRLSGILSEAATGELVGAFGITPVKQSRNLDWNLHMGFDGYQGMEYRSTMFPNGVPFQLIARSFESGAVWGGRKRGEKPTAKTAYWRQPTPFAAPAVKATKTAAIRAMRETVYAELRKEFEGGK